MPCSPMRRRAAWRMRSRAFIVGQSSLPSAVSVSFVRTNDTGGGVGLAGQAEALAKGAVSSREVVEESLESIRRVKDVAAFRDVAREAAVREARSTDRRRRGREGLL